MALTGPRTPWPRGRRGLRAGRPEGLGAEAARCPAGTRKGQRALTREPQGAGPLSVHPGSAVTGQTPGSLGPQCPDRPFSGVISTTVPRNPAPSGHGRPPPRRPGPALMPAGVWGRALTTPCLSPEELSPGAGQATCGVSPVTSHVGPGSPAAAPVCSHHGQVSPSSVPGGRGSGKDRRSPGPGPGNPTDTAHLRPTILAKPAQGGRTQPRSAKSWPGHSPCRSP